MLPRQFELLVPPAARYHTGQALIPVSAPPLPPMPICPFWQRPAADPTTGTLTCSTMAMVRFATPLLGPVALGVGVFALTSSVIWTTLAVLFLGIPALVVVDMAVNPGDGF